MPGRLESLRGNMGITRLLGINIVITYAEVSMYKNVRWLWQNLDLHLPFAASQCKWQDIN